MEYITLATFNTAGLSRTFKRMELDHCCKMNGIGVCAIQESNLSESRYDMAAGYILSSPPASRHAGLAFWIAKNFPIKIVSMLSVCSDMILELTFTIYDKLYVMYNIHLPHKDSKVMEVLQQWIEHLKAWKIGVLGLNDSSRSLGQDKEHQQDRAEEEEDFLPDTFLTSQEKKETPEAFFLMGDLNLQLERALQFSNSQWKKRTPRLVLQNIFSALEIDFISLTLISDPPPTTRNKAILDYICVPKHWRTKIHSISINSMVESDHSMVVAKIVYDFKWRRAPYWRFKNELLSNVQFVSSMNAFLRTRLLSQPRDAKCFLTWWDLLKKDIIIASKNCWDTIVKKHRREKVEDTSVSETFKTCTVSYKGFMGRQSNIFVLTDDSGSIVSDPDEVLEKAFDFYSKLYCAKNTCVPPKRMTFGLNAIEHSEDLPICTELTLGDLYEAASRMNLGKAPGVDGITLEFYLKFWVVLGPLVLEWFKYIIQVGSLFGSAAVGVISLIPKSGDLRKLTNWRPITLLTVELKIIAKAITNKALPEVASVISHQTALPGSSLFTSLSIIRDIITIQKKLKKPQWLVAVDQCKAFDNVAHDFLFHLLDVIGLSPFLTRALRAIYSGFLCTVKNGALLSRPFPYLKGIRQGDSSSTMLFALAIQPVINALHLALPGEGFEINKRDRILLTVYADDLTLFISEEASIDSIVDVFNKVSVYSGAVINTEKSLAFGMNVEGSYNKNQPLNGRITKTYDSIKILGIVFKASLNICHKQWAEKIISTVSTIEANFQKLINMTFVMRAAWAKLKLWPRWSFLLKVLQPSMEQILQLTRIFMEVIWLRGKHWLSKDILAASVENGGIDMMLPEERIQTLRVSLMARLCCLKMDSHQLLLAKATLGRYASQGFSLELLHSIPDYEALKAISAVYGAAFKAWDLLPVSYVPISKEDIMQMPVTNSRFLRQFEEPILVNDQLAGSLGIRTIGDLDALVPSHTRLSGSLTRRLKKLLDDWQLPPWPDGLS